jgi:hypothetical protein
MSPTQNDIPSDHTRLKLKGVFIMDGAPADLAIRAAPTLATRDLHGLRPDLPGVAYKASDFLDSFGGHAEELRVRSLILESVAPEVVRVPLALISTTVVVPTGVATGVAEGFNWSSIATGAELEACLPAPTDIDDWRLTLRPADKDLVVFGVIPANTGLIRQAVLRGEQPPPSAPTWIAKAIYDAGGNNKHVAVKARRGRVPGDQTTEYHHVFAHVKARDGRDSIDVAQLVTDLTRYRDKHRADIMSREGYLTLTDFSKHHEDPASEIWIP